MTWADDEAQSEPRSPGQATRQTYVNIIAGLERNIEHAQVRLDAYRDALKTLDYHLAKERESIDAEQAEIIRRQMEDMR